MSGAHRLACSRRVWHGINWRDRHAYVARALAEPTLTDFEKLVLAEDVLGFGNDTTGISCAKPETSARDTGLSLRRVTGARVGLKRKGWEAAVEHEGRSCLVFHEAAKVIPLDAARQGCTERRRVPPPPDAPEHGFRHHDGRMALRRRVVTKHGVPPGVKVLLTAMLLDASRSKVLHRRHADLAALAGKSVRTIGRLLAVARRLGVLDWQGGRGAGCAAVFVFRLPPAEPPGEKYATPACDPIKVADDGAETPDENTPPSGEKYATPHKETEERSLNSCGDEPQRTVLRLDDEVAMKALDGYLARHNLPPVHRMPWLHGIEVPGPRPPTLPTDDAFIDWQIWLRQMKGEVPAHA